MLTLIAQYKKISFILISVLLLGYSTSAKNYYVSNSGNDSNDGLSISTPWQSLSKVSSFTGLTAGDSVLFNCGDIFYGTLVINNSGSSANPITIGAYGTGPNPVITGFTTITDWTNLGGNIWESTNAVSTLPTCNMVVINGVNTAMGRYPNQGYLTYQSFTSTSITSSSLNSSITDWTGAIAVIRKNNFIIDFDTVKSQSGTVLTHSQHSAYNGTANYGFFIENDSRTLDTANEWYYNSSTKKLRIYSTSMPANVQISTIDSLVKVIGRNNITFTNISFTGSNTATFAINFSHHPKILNCNIDFAGINAIITRGGSCDSAKIINCTINHSNNKAIDLGGASPNCLVSYTTIKNTGINAGMTPGSDGTFTGVLVNSDNSIVENCIVDSTGYIAIGFYGNNTIIRNNFVTNYCQVKHDGGALYSFVSAGGTPFTGEQVLNNIIMNGNSSTEGTTEAVAIIHGIYFDGNANVEVSGNTAANCAYAGIYIHNAYNLNIHNNTGFNNGLYQTLFASFATGSPIRNDIVNNNIFVSKDSSQLVASFQSVANDISGFGTIDSNYYARPIDDNVDFYVTINNYTNFFNYTLAQWQAYSGFDSHSHKSPKTITTLNDLRFEYNATSVSKTIPLDGYYIDVKNVSYNGTITLAPFTSAVLIRNIPPIASAGPDQLITLPINTVNLSGSGTDIDGSISSYHWSEVSGATQGTITNADSASTSVTGLVQGVYQFELDVTDNNGATGKDTMQVTVNVPPTANAGPDQLITLPTNTVALSGSGTDPDGTIASYNWTEISGPESGAITNPGSASTTVTGLVGGVYQFELDVTDNNGATGKDTMQVAVNVPPTANAGPDQLITLPTNTVALSGSGTDADGTVSTYNWTEISGPESGAIANPGSASTTVTGLVGGVYQFELDVTDNSGATGKDTMQVTVNVPPTANAGPDQLITLPTNTVALSGSGNDPDGTIASYNWTSISGPTLGTITNTAAAITSVTGLVQGVYQFELDVTDNNGAIGKDTVQVTVNAPPTANAGPDQLITLPTNTVTLTGSGTDPDGTIASYNWTEISGPAGATITSPTSTVTSVTGLVQGVYQFELDVTDNSGAIGSATVQITVNAANIPPTANAGTDQSITLPVSTVTLTGSGTDPDGTIASYNWTETSGPAGIIISNPTSAITSVIGLVQGVYQFELDVTDNNGAIGSANVQITVNAANIPPTSNAGADQLITLPTNTVTLSGSGTDIDGTISAYNWAKISGPAQGIITNANSASTTVTALVQGVYKFQLTVTDNNGATGVDTVQITVNVPPTSNAGADQLITLPINTVTLTGSGSDVDGTISAYNWTKVSGPSSGSITNASSVSTTVTALVQGVYQFQLKVTDNNGATGVDTVQITVNPANIPPTANAGPDQLITLPTNTVTLSGSGTDIDGTISAYNWTKISGPSSGTINSTSSASTTVTALVQGVYKFQLTVTDNNGATGVDTVQITVNVPPTANAGADQLITLPANTVTLTGTGTDVDGTISSYNWTKVSGPAAGTITNANSASTTVTALVNGVYKFQLKVTDNYGATGVDTVQITVNVPPTANAGPDQLITLPTSTVILSGSGTDVDGTISAYSWTKLSGSPASGTITNAGSASTTVTGLVKGIYKFQLKVTDNNGATGVDTVQITVNTPPTANAGADQLITLPTNTVTLTGTGTDVDGTISAYNWTKVSGPVAGTITNASSASTTVTALVQGVYKFQLKVTDNYGATGVDTVQITVNVPPTANAGPDQLITLPTNSVTLSGSGSDPNGTISAYSWTKLSGSPASGTITNAGLASTTVTGLVKGVYKFQLKVTDNNGATGVDTVQITVNTPPTANAGPDQLITLPTNTVTLTGTGTDVDGTISSYNWTKVSGPAAGTITNANSASTTVTALVNGVYKFQLKVTDNYGATGVDTVQITVNVPPTANAGPDQLITLPTNSVTLSGSGSDPNGIISAYKWTKISGSTATITNASSATTTVTALVKGVYKFQLKVTDNNGATGVDTVQVTVNVAPVANAGPDQLITLPTNTVTLSGSGTDADGTIAAYNWTKIAGPSSGTIANASLASTTVTALVQGVYKFQLKVTDNNGATGVDTVQITVNAPPTANAGLDQSITLPTSTVTLSGSGTDVDGTISAYKWTKLSGSPSSGTITSSTSASTTVTSLVQGVYKFQLKVTDNNGATGVDTVQVTVNPAANIPPTANAGPDQSITLPTNKVTLTGSGTDPDGTISAYNWTKISGPAATIASPNSKTTSVSGLVQGVYKFQLMVTDNKGATGKDTMQVTVNPAASGTNLVTFSAQPAGDNITLTWETTNETNVSGFDIEKKAADTWEKMGYLQSAGGISKNHYSFNDYLPVTGLNYYRLKMLGSEGGFIYSDIINVKLENVLHQNVPNPFSNTTTIPFEVIDNSLVKIVVYDALGTPVAVLVNAMMQRGSYQVQWNAGNIVSGTYFYTIVIGYNIRTMKMLKLN